MTDMKSLSYITGKANIAPGLLLRRRFRGMIYTTGSSGFFLATKSGSSFS